VEYARSVVRETSSFSREVVLFVHLIPSILRLSRDVVVLEDSIWILMEFVRNLSLLLSNVLLVNILIKIRDACLVWLLAEVVDQLLSA